MSSFSKMLPKELEEMIGIAGRLFDADPDIKNKTTKELFIQGFLHGREFTLDQLGVHDDEDDEADEKAYEFAKKYLDK